MSVQSETKDSPEFLKHAQLLLADISKNDETIEAFCNEQGISRTDYDSLVLNRDRAALDGFLKYLWSPQSEAMAPPKVDSTHPICDYYVSTSHNTYLWGNQLYGKSSADAYQKVLERGARSVEIDVWDPKDDSDSESDGDSGMAKLGQKFKQKVSLLKSKARRDHEHENKHEPRSSTDESHRSLTCEPRVLHGHTATKEVPFRTVCETIGRYAFQKCDLPVVVSLEVHTSPEMQKKMVEIMKECWAPYLNLDIDIDDDTPLPVLESLRKQILIKVKYTAPEKAKEKHAPKSAKTEDDSSDEEEASRKGRIIPELGSLGIYTRSYHFKSFDQPEAKVPTHVFSLSEKKVLSTHKQQAATLFRHNKSYLMRAYPQAFRIDSTNLDPAPFWRSGVQMVALNWQHCNASMMLNHAMFQGTGGWALKPEGYRSQHHATSRDVAIERGELDLSIELLAGQNIGPSGKHLKLYVRCELHVEESQEERDDDLSEATRNTEGQIKTHSEVARGGGNNPDFGGQCLRFKSVPDIAEELTFVRLKIMDDETLGRDELMAWACFKLNRLQQGIRLIHLYDPEGLPTNGVLLVRIKKSVMRST